LKVPHPRNFAPGTVLVRCVDAGAVAPYTVRLQQAFGIIVIAFALSAFLQYDAIALGWLGQFFPKGRTGL
jgi:hypothetical protein